MTSLHVLLVEDDLTNQAMIGWLLDDLGHTHHVVANGQECLDMLAREAFDAVIMDYEMPVMPGDIATKHIRNSAFDYAHIPIIGLTGHDEQSYRQNCLRVGMTTVLHKPVSAEKLSAALVGITRRTNANSTITAPPSLHPTDILDAEKLLALTRHDQVRTEKLMHLFETTFLEQWRAMHDGIADHQAEIIARAAHTLKGAASNLQAKEMATLALSLEQAAKMVDYTTAQTVFDCLKPAMYRVRIAFRTMLANL